MEQRTKQQTQLKVALYALLCAFGTLLVCSKSSFLYPINDWYDANVYLTAGKGMLRGMVMYRDLYDHKGPLLYALHTLCALVSQGSFLGVFLLEGILLAWALGNVYRLMKLYGENQFSLAAMPVFALLVCASVSFASGDSAEELSLPLILCSLISVLSYFKRSDERMERGPLMLQGALIGCVFWMKFTCIGIQAGLLLALLMRHARRRQWKMLFSSLGWLLCGFLLSTLPWILYFGLNGAISDWLRVYFYDNLARYSNTESLSFAGRINKALLCGVDFLGNNLQYTLPLLGGLCWIAFDSARADRWECGAVWLGALTGGIATFIGGKDYVYYGFSLAALAVFGIIGLSRVLGMLFALRKGTPAAASRKTRILAAVLCAVLCLALSPLISPNVTNPSGVTILEKREDTMQYRFASTIAKVPDATLLNYYFMDAGFYTAAGIAPSVKYYHYCNVPLPKMLQEQNRYVTEGLVDFVVTRGRNPADIDTLYTLADSCPANDRSWYDTVYLFVRKDLILD